MNAAFHGTVARLTNYYRLVRVLAAARSSFDVALPLLPVLARLGLALPAAYLIHRTIRPLTSGPAKYRILVLEKQVFNDDALASFGPYGDFAVYGFPRAVLKSICAGFLPRWVRDDNNYVSQDPVVQRRKLQYQRFLRGMWRVIRLFRRYDAVVTGNWGYHAEREFAAVLENLGTPFIALHKECLKSLGLADLFKGIYRNGRGPFTGRRILVYNELEKEDEIAAGVVTADKITVTGMPRLDRVHRWRQAVASGAEPTRATSQVLFFFFSPTAQLPVMYGRDENLNWGKFCEHTCHAVVRLARENPDLPVVIKPKMSDERVLHSLLGREEPLPANLQVVADADPFDLIRDSAVVCGFNTTALLEAIAAGKPCIVPRFAEAKDPCFSRYIVDMEDAVEYAPTPAALGARLCALARTARPIPAALGPAQNRVLQKWVGNIDGRAGQRVHDAVLAELSAV